ncbi:TrmH family RNA methyltransferase [Corynebacterium bovis]|uniref:TrmH family RNA methyltransferase n=1 Tax=Corynebacterium bovis TaxID=36808 RepID=UPI000F6474F3|nr:RNA methyltransferase [Corynebacterium bovis]RRO95831.1 RNA methyltransferase [Corynebacterium bovis]RRQ16241.1 RNA methyltransferase [Corynebacterium bovis]
MPETPPQHPDPSVSPVPAADWRHHLNDEPFTERTPRVVAAAKLHRASARRKAGRFIAEGTNAVGSALRHGRVVEVFVSADALDRESPFLDAAVPRQLEARVSVVTPRALRQMSESVTPAGILAVCDTQLTDLAAVTARGRLVCVPVETSEPGNAGTLVRVADACGCDGVVFAGETVDPQGGKAVRASAGSLFHLPVAREAGVAAVVDALHGAGFLVLATAMDGDVRLDHAADEVLRWADAGAEGEPPMLAQPTAWLFGNEAHGLGAWSDLADVRVSVPMYGRAESLNLATAASVCLYESARALGRVPGAGSGPGSVPGTGTGTGTRPGAL